MIISFNRYNGGGGSGSGVTPEQVQQQIDSALTPYWESAITESAITEAVSGLATEQYVQDALSGVSLEGYWNSAQTEEAISAATAGKADAANITGGLQPLPTVGNTWFPVWNKQGIITGTSVKGYNPDSYINGKKKRFVDTNGNGGVTIYAPQSAGTAGDILVSTGNGAPVWSAVTMPDMAAYTPTSGFSTINGSAITNGGNIVIQGGGGDISGYWNSAQTKSYVDNNVRGVQDQIDTMDEVVSQALVDLDGRVDAISAATPTVDLSGYYTSAQTEEAISAATSGKADAAVNPPRYEARMFPKWNAQGIITGSTGSTIEKVNFSINGQNYPRLKESGNKNYQPIYAPNSAGTAGDILVSTGNGAPVWSAVTQDMVTSTDVRHIVKLTQAEYDQLATKDPYTFYIIVKSN